MDPEHRKSMAVSASPRTTGRLLKMHSVAEVGIVVIGRNEGERLRRCLSSIDPSLPTVYVDSDSTDGSVLVAQSNGATVVELDRSKPCSAARARNSGFREITQSYPQIQYVQFVDGDCELSPEWLDAAVRVVDTDDEMAIVCGVLLEREPQSSVYNRLCAMEWKAPFGDTDACGGIFLVRSEAFERAGGFNEGMIAGEEPDLCERLRSLGWRIHRVRAQMAVHDAGMTHFSQWWKRSVRSGYGYADLARRHRNSQCKRWRREVLRNWVWAVGMPGLTAALVVPSSGSSLLLLLLYPLWVVRIARGRVKRMNDTWSDGLRYGVFCMIGKAAGVAGHCVYVWHRVRGRSAAVIEYKSSPCKTT